MSLTSGPGRQQTSLRGGSARRIGPSVPLSWESPTTTTCLLLLVELVAIRGGHSLPGPAPPQHSCLFSSFPSFSEVRMIAMINMKSPNFYSIRTFTCVFSMYRYYFIIECFGLEGTFEAHLTQPPPAVSGDIFN